MLDWNTILIRLSLAALLGAFVGMERERKDWAAGIRTHMMVCVGSCLIMLVSSFGFSGILHEKNIVLDPSRVAAQVVSGIGFIGVGTILFIKQGTIRGLTTASGLWTVAAIGLATGGGMYFAATATTFIALVILWALAPLEKIYAQRFKQKKLKIITDLTQDNTELLNNLLNKEELKIQSFEFERHESHFIYHIQLGKISDKQVTEIINELKNYEPIKDIFWIR